MTHSYNYCPHCAAPLRLLTQVEDGGPRERLRCPACAWTHWNNPTPVLAAIIEMTDREGQVLLARNAAWQGRMFALITGFMEAGESAEEGIVREVLEETGLRVDAPSLVGVYDFQRMNQLIVAYHVAGAARSCFRRSLPNTSCSAPKTCAAGAPARATRWPTG
jgi:NAD+ diphosphatase